MRNRETNGHYATNSRDLPKNGSFEGKAPDAEEALSQRFSIVTG
jgi:hypothetical protein